MGVARMGQAFTRAIGPTLRTLTASLKDLETFQASMLTRIQGQYIGFSPEDKKELKGFEKTIAQIPEYQAKLDAIARKMQSIDKRVASLKRKSLQAQARI